MQSNVNLSNQQCWTLWLNYHNKWNLLRRHKSSITNRRQNGKMRRKHKKNETIPIQQNPLSCEYAREMPRGITNIFCYHKYTGERYGCVSGRATWSVSTCQVVDCIEPYLSRAFLIHSLMDACQDCTSMIRLNLTQPNSNCPTGHVSDHDWNRVPYYVIKLLLLHRRFLSLIQYRTVGGICRRRNIFRARSTQRSRYWNDSGKCHCFAIQRVISVITVIVHIVFVFGSLLFDCSIFHFFSVICFPCLLFAPNRSVTRQFWTFILFVRHASYTSSSHNPTEQWTRKFFFSPFRSRETKPFSFHANDTILKRRFNSSRLCINSN